MRITKENFTLHNIKRAIIAYKRKFQIYLFSKTFFRDMDSIKKYFDAPIHIQEQFIKRLNDMKHSKQGAICLDKGICVCGCDVPDLQLSNDACEGKCYGPMMSAEQWNEYKLCTGVRVDLHRKLVYYIKR